MHQDLYEDLYNKHVYLLEKSSIEYIDVGNGWYNILDTLFTTMCADVNYVLRRMKLADNANDPGLVLTYQKQLIDDCSKLPYILQIKDMFGALVIYHNHPPGADENSKTRNSSLIDFAIKMSKVTCSECGSPGKTSNNASYTRTVCDIHLHLP